MSSRSGRSRSSTSKRARQLRAVDESFTRSVRKLRAGAAKGRKPDESFDEFMERLCAALEEIARRAYWRQLDIFAGVKGKHGRPKTGLGRAERPNRRGRKNLLSTEEEDSLLRKLDALKRAYASGKLRELDRDDAALFSRGETLSDKGALALLAVRKYTADFMKDGLLMEDARAKARAEVRGLGRRLRSHQIRISRLRGRRP